MADVVEHIEQEPLHKLFQKIHMLLNDNGYLVIHTNPNKLYYDVSYATRANEARRLGAYMPRNPRSYYEEIMHINEQTPNTLEETLKQHFPYMEVWTASGWDSNGLLEWFRKDCPYDTMCSHNEIYAVASRSEVGLEKFAGIVDEIRNYKLEQNDINVEIQSLGKQTFNGNNYTVKARTLNNGTKQICLYTGYPVNISYHIIDESGNTVVWDGIRTGLISNLPVGGILEQDIQIQINNDLIKDGIRYKAVITLVQEGMFWFNDIDKAFSCEIDLGMSEKNV